MSRTVPDARLNRPAAGVPHFGATRDEFYPDTQNSASLTGDDQRVAFAPIHADDRKGKHLRLHEQTVFTLWLIS